MRRIHAEHHSSFMPSTLRTTFVLDIPPDASPTFQVGVPFATSGQTNTGGLEWKVRFYLLVAMGSTSVRENVDRLQLKNLVMDGPRGEWGTSWTAAHTVAPLERTMKPSFGALAANTPKATQSWASFLANAFLGPTERASSSRDSDGAFEDEEQEEDSEEDWREVKIEMVECEVPIKVWPSNTAFKANEVVFEV